MKGILFPVIVVVLVCLMLVATVISKSNQDLRQCRNCGAKKHLSQLLKFVATEELTKMDGPGHELLLCEKCVRNPQGLGLRKIQRNMRSWGFGESEATIIGHMAYLLQRGSPFVKVVRSNEIPEITNPEQIPKGGD